MYNEDIIFNVDDYIQTSTGNKISRLSNIIKPQSLEIPAGRCIIMNNVIIRCDLAAIKLNKYIIISEDTIIKPSYTFISGFRYIPITIGNHCYIGKRCVIESASIGVGCYICDDVILSKRSILKDYVYVLEGCVVPNDMVIPPFSIVSGCPATIIGEMPESTSTSAIANIITKYKSYIPNHQ
jgi:dynactin-5